MSSLYITESGAFLRKRGGMVVIGRNNEILIEVPIERIEDVTLVDTVQISSQLITEFLERNIPVSWISSFGKFYGSLINNSKIDIMKHKKQFDLLEESSFYTAISKKVIFAKIHNQLTILRRYNRELQNESVDSDIKNILAVRRNIFLAESDNQLRGYEGIISRIYFSALGKIVKEPFSFEKRTKNPPQDPVNSMLSLGYSMLFNEILANIISTGLHPYVGFFHKIAKGHPALASDLIEEWRAVIVDSLVLAIISKNIISSDMFYSSDEGCFLLPEGRKIFLKEYNKKIRSSNQYFAEKLTYRECMARQCKKYSQALMSNDSDIYIPIELR